MVAMRTLLAERFKLVVHRETREMDIYALVVARPDGKLGPALKPTTQDCEAMMAAARRRPASRSAAGPEQSRRLRHARNLRPARRSMPCR